MQNSVNPGRVALVGNPIKIIILQAFNVKPEQLVGPSWLDSECIDIVATLPNGASTDQLPAMLQALLVERFKLVAHREDRQQSGYALVIDKSGIKFKQSDPNSAAARAQIGRVTFGASRELSAIKGSMTMASLTRFLSLRLDRPVEDATGLQGKYDIDVSWTPDKTLEKIGAFADAGGPGAASPAIVPAAPSGIDIFNAVKQTLGLKFEARKQQVEVIVIDGISRTPLEN